MAYWRLLCLAVLIVSATPCLAEIAPVPDPRGLEANDADTRRATCHAIRTDRGRVIYGLIGIVSKDASDPAAKDLAIQLLGDLRALEAVDTLVENLMFLPSEMRVTSLRPTEEYYPAARALQQIGGQQTIMALIVRRIRAPRPAEERHVAAWVIMSTEGKDQAVFRLTKYAESIQPTDPMRGRVEDAAAFVRDYKPSFSVPRPPTASTMGAPSSGELRTAPAR